MESRVERKQQHASPIASPFLIVIDDREKTPYSFSGLRADAAKKNRPLLISTTTGRLDSGDYSIAGYESLVAVERKSLEDLYSTLGGNRERFEAEHERLACLEFAAVVIEASWDEIIAAPPLRSQLNPKTVHRTSISWAIRYGVHWIAMGSRRAAEIETYRILEMFWRQKQRKNQPGQSQ